MEHVDRVVVVDDGSTDGTALITKSLGARLVSHDQNRGQGAAIATCLNVAREMGADVLVTLDADGQHDPEDISKVVQPILSGQADIVIGSRFQERVGGEVPKYRLVGLKIFIFATNRLAKQKIHDSESGFRAYSKKAIDLIRLYETGMGWTPEIAVRAGNAGLRVQEVPISIRYKGIRPGKNTLVHGFEILSAIIRLAGEAHPSLFIGVPGAILAIVGVYGLWVFQRYLTMQQLAPASALFLTVLLLVAVIGTNAALILYLFSVLSRRDCKPSSI